MTCWMNDLLDDEKLCFPWMYDEFMYGIYKNVLS